MWLPASIPFKPVILYFLQEGWVDFALISSEFVNERI